MRVSTKKRNRTVEFRRWGDRHAWKFLLVGIAGIAWFNWRVWTRDKVKLQQKSRPVPLPPLENWPELPMVSTLVAAWNEEGNIQPLIDSFHRLRYPNKEMVLCAGGSDSTYYLTSKCSSPQILVLKQHAGEGKQHALQRCLQQASGKIIFLTDADCILNSDSFELLVFPLVAHIESVTTGVSRPGNNQMGDFFVRNQWAPQRYSEVLKLSQYPSGLLGRNCAIMRSVVEEAWKTEEAVPTGTDYFLALRVIKAGQRILNVPQSSVETIFPETFSQYVKQQSRWLRNLLVLGHRYHDRRHVSHALRTSFFGTSLLVMPIMPLLIGNLGFVTWIVSWAAVVFNRVRYMGMLNCINRERKPIISIELFKVLFGDWFGWAKVLVDLLNPERRKKW